MLQQQQPGMQQQQAVGQGHNPVWPLQDRQYDAAEVQQTRQMSASVPAGAHAGKIPDLPVCACCMCVNSFARCNQHVEFCLCGFDRTLSCASGDLAVHYNVKEMACGAKTLPMQAADTLITFPNACCASCDILPCVMIAITLWQLVPGNDS